MEMKKVCELCGRPATLFCESDEATLCWPCDEKVHSANFLVAKHTRRLLCHVCHSPTPWAASGSKFGPTLSVCDGCFRRRGAAFQRDTDDGCGGGVVVADTEECSSVNNDGDSGRDDDNDDDNEDEEEEEDDNQVVPWSCDPAASSSSCGEEESVNTYADCGFRSGAKRVFDIAFDDDSDVR